MSVLYLYVLYLSRSLNTCRDYGATEQLLFKTLKYGLYSVVAPAKGTPIPNILKACTWKLEISLTIEP